MTDIASVTQDPGPLPGGDLPEKDVRGRSLFQLALLRLRRNRAAMAGFAVLALVTVFCFAGPHVVTQRYDQVFSSYVGVGPSLDPRPSQDVLEGVAGSVAARARLDLVAFEAEDGTYRATVRNEAEAVDPRVTRFFDRANEFSGGTGASIVETADEGRTAVVEGTVGQQYFLMGTDRNGRDLMVRVMVGGQISLVIGILASLVALVIGVTYGAIAGYIGGRVDNVMMRLIEILYSLPFVFLVIMLVVFFGRSFVLIFLVIGLVEWLDMARIVRGQTLSIKRREFVAAAEAMGVTDRQIIWRHVVPNTIGPVVVFVTIVVPKVILLESFLSFLGLGVQAPLTSWGALIADGAQTLQSAPWLLVFPAIFFCVTLFALNFIGDGLRDAFDPKDR